MNKNKLIKALTPFWIYWGSLLAGCILFFIFPGILFLFLPVAFIGVFIWAVIVYMVGGAVQKKTELKKIWGRAGISFVCSLMTTIIFPVCTLIDDFIKWNHFYWQRFLSDCTDPLFLIVLSVHFIIFWVGEELEYIS